MKSGYFPNQDYESSLNEVDYRLAGGQRPDLSRGLIHYWALGNLNDSVGGVNLTNNNAVTFGTAKHGNGAVFAAGEGSNQNLAGTGITLSGGFTVSYWLYLDSMVANFLYPLMLLTDDAFTPGAIGFYFYISKASNGFSLYAYNQNQVGIYEPAWYVLNPPTGSWVHSVFSCSTSSGPRSWFNLHSGVPDEFSALPLDISDWNNMTMIIGCFPIGMPEPSQCIVGKVDEIGIWNRPLTQSEVISLYNGGAGKFYPF